MSALGELLVLLGVNTSGMTSGLAKGKAELTGFATQAEASSARVTSAFSGMGSMLVMTGGLLAATGAMAALDGAVKSAMSNATSLTALNTALSANVAGWDGNTAAIMRTINARKALGFTDTEQQDALAILVARTGNAAEALRIEAVAMDLARLKSISLEQASKAISMGMMGVGRALKEIGINVGDYTNKAEVLGAVEAKAAGQADAFGQTTAGAMDYAKIQIDEAWRSVGERLLPVMKTLAVDVAPAVAQAIVGIADAASNTAKEIDNLTSILRTLNGTNIGPGTKAPEFEITPSSVFGSHLGPALANMGWLGAANQEAEARRQFDAQQQAEKVRRLNEGFSQEAAASSAGADAAQKAFETAWMTGGLRTTTAMLRQMASSSAAYAQAALSAGSTAAKAYADGLQKNLTDIDAALTNLRTVLKTGLSPTEQIARLGGLLFGADIAKGLNDSSPESQAAAYATVAAIVAQLALLKGAAYGEAVQAAFWWQKGWRSQVLAGDTPSEGNATNAALKGLAATAQDVIGAFKPAAAGSTFLDQTSKAAGAVKSALTNAFDAAKAAAQSFFDLLHSRNLKAIDDARNLANLSATGPVSQARAQLQAEQDARQEASLRAALAAAKTPADQATAQQALSDFLAQQNITKMQEAADAQVKANDAVAQAATDAENARAKADAAALGKQKTTAGIAQTLVTPKAGIAAAAAAAVTGGGTIIVQIGSEIIAKITDERLFIRAALTTP